MNRNKSNFSRNILGYIEANAQTLKVGKDSNWLEKVERSIWYQGEPLVSEMSIESKQSCNSRERKKVRRSAIEEEDEAKVQKIKKIKCGRSL